MGAGRAPFDEELFSFVTTFAPSYMTAEYRRQFWVGKSHVDFSHEREWRVPHDLDFDLSNVRFVVVDTYEDMAKAPRELKDAIGRENWLIMSNWERVEKLWPIHQLPVTVPFAVTEADQAQDALRSGGVSEVGAACSQDLGSEVRE